MAERVVDVVVIGAGPAGEVAAGRLAEAGLGVVVVEHHLVGGECSYYACMPSKALLRPGELLAETRRVAGVQAGPLDVAAVLSRRDEVIRGLDDTSHLPWLEERGVEVVRGHARLDGERRVRVGPQVLLARRAVVVATGSAPALPTIPGLKEVGAWSNREATTAAEVPESLVVLGGGVAGVELAQAWASLGSRVTVVEGGPRLIGREEPFASELVDTALREAGVEVRTRARAVSASRGGGDVVLGLADGSSVAGAELLVTVGRRPTTDGLGLESVGLEPGVWIDVDASLRSPRQPWLYAVGDANGRAPLTHMGKYQARVAADAILGREAALVADGAVSPRVIFTDPQVAAVGHTLATAEEAGLQVRAADAGTGDNAGGAFVGLNAPGTSRLVVDLQRSVVVGATFTGPEVADLLHAATIAVVGELPLDLLAHAVPSFPTRSEVWLDLLDAARP